MIAPTRFTILSEAFYDYWKFEDGAEMLLQLNEIPSLSDAESYVPLLYQKDDFADAVIADYFTNAPFPAALQKITDFATGKLPITEASESVRILLNQMREIPEWLEHDKLERGRRCCNRSGKSGLIVLRNYSLMLGYQSAAINKPLVATGALHSGAVKRIADTTNFWFGVTGIDALNEASDGFLYCLRTRLVHAYSRVMIKDKLDWKIEEQGEPLNYWDMVATYLGFSLVFMQGLRKLGLTIDNDEAASVYHLWKYIGFLIGIPPHIMPQSDQEAIKSLYLWSKTQPETDADSIALAQSLHLEPLAAPWPPKKFQKRFIQQVNLAFNYHLIGERSCKVLQLPQSKYVDFVKVVVATNRADEALANRIPSHREWQIRHGRAEQSIITTRVNMPMH